ncbi:MAG TPA: hypothetical protein VGG72_18425 [Bryobacteraceae bacterium]
MMNETVFTTAELLESPKADGLDGNKPGALLPADESASLRQRWSAIQGSFVDTPRDAVQKADELVATVVQRVAEIYAGERARLEADWSRGNEVSTEDLRQALRRYRSFFDRLLSV